MAIVLASTIGRADALESRYFFSGDGQINIANGGVSFRGVYRRADGTYNEAALKTINKVFGARSGDISASVSPRLIEFLGYLTKQLKPGARITIASGYRDPGYNTKLRNMGKLAAKASLHQYGMACDIKITGVASERVWNFIKELGFGGTGFYHGGLVHVDVGPARFWDETTSGVDTGISDDNKLIAIVADKDIYLAGEMVQLRFIRMTAFPIGVERVFTMETKKESGEWREIAHPEPKFASDTNGQCPKFQTIAQMSGIKWHLPQDIKPGRYRIGAKFCEKTWDDMPETVTTPEFEVR